MTVCGSSLRDVVKPTRTCSVVLLLMFLFLMSGGLPRRTEQNVGLSGNELLHKRAVLLITLAAQNTNVQRGSLETDTGEIQYCGEHTPEFLHTQ